MTTTLSRPDATPIRSAELLLAHAHLRLGSLALARTELETLAGMGKLDDLGLVDLAAGGPATWQAPAKLPRWRCVATRNTPSPC